MEAQQQYHYQYQQQPAIETTLTTSQTSYDPSQIQQSYDQSSYYSYHQQQPQDYSAYYYQQQQQDYSASYQPTDPNLIHPPGVPLTVDSQQTHVVNHQNLYYPHGVMASQPSAHQGYTQTGGTQAGRPVRGRATFGRHGRGRGGGRGRGRGKHQTARTSAPSAPGGAQSAAACSKPPTRMAWCEVCRTDCTTFEVLELHKNGKRHKKNLKVQAELMGIGRQPTVPNPETIPPHNAEGSNTDHLPNDNIAPESALSENKTDKPETSGPLPSQESIRKDHFGGRGGFKRRMRGGRGSKWMRAYDGSRRPVEPPKPKLAVPLICELCNVKCESQVVFENHITGKKHIANMNRFQGHQAALGEGIQALYPSISHLLPSTSIISQANQQHGSLDAQALASMMLSQQNLQDPQAAQAALTLLLHQNGIHDVQTLIAQLIPYLLTQFQAPGTLPAQEAALGIPSQIPPSEEPPIPIESDSLNVTVENQTEQQAVTADAADAVDAADVESEVATETNDKPANIPPESESQP